MRTASLLTLTGPIIERAARHGLSDRTFRKLVQTASLMPEVRPEVVKVFKTRILSGEYPPKDALKRLTGRLFRMVR